MEFDCVSLNSFSENPAEFRLLLDQSHGQELLKAEKKTLWNNLKVTILDWFGLAEKYKFSSMANLIATSIENIPPNLSKDAFIKSLKEKIGDYNGKHQNSECIALEKKITEMLETKSLLQEKSSPSDVLNTDLNKQKKNDLSSISNRKTVSERRPNSLNTPTTIRSTSEPYLHKSTLSIPNSDPEKNDPDILSPNILQESTSEVIKESLNSSEVEVVLHSEDPTVSQQEKEELAVQQAGIFNKYKIKLPNDHPCHGVTLTGMGVRPANLFFESLLSGTQVKETLPGKELFAFQNQAPGPDKQDPHQIIGDLIRNRAKSDPDKIVSFSAHNRKGHVYINGIKNKANSNEGIDLEEIYGKNTYQISYRELEETLESQRIFTSPDLPLPFYTGLKKASKEDNWVVLPGNDLYPYLMREILNLTEPKDQGCENVTLFMQEVAKNPLIYGFKDEEQFNKLLGLTLYEIGSMVVKTEDYHVFIDGDGKLLDRKPGTQDAICLINACGIRGIRSHKISKQRKENKIDPDPIHVEIMTNTFKTAFVAAGGGILVFPAVGMGIWSGDPKIYWTAFLNAVLESDVVFDSIYVNPGHRASVYGPYKGCSGDEFQTIVEERKQILTENGENDKVEKLSKIKNLFDKKTDLVHLARCLKQQCPDKTVSLFNASDPDVTLGNHVGEYVNNLCHPDTTEENYTAQGSNGICFEEITRVHDDKERLFQTSFKDSLKQGVILRSAAVNAPPISPF